MFLEHLTFGEESDYSSPALEANEQIEKLIALLDEQTKQLSSARMLLTRKTNELEKLKAELRAEKDASSLYRSYVMRLCSLTKEEFESDLLVSRIKSGVYVP